jgi:Holliday junction resolvase RusA-like endonuclease
MQKKIILNITPQTRVTSTQSDSVLFRIPQDCPFNCGLPRRSTKQPLVEKIIRGKPKMVRYGCTHSLSVEGMNRKKRLERYNDYKESLIEVAFDKNFVLPEYNTSITFFLPVFDSWTNKKKKAMHFQLHRVKPDLDNFLKAFQDALKAADCSIAHYGSLAKRWVNFPTGYIEIITTDGPPPEYKP